MTDEQRIRSLFLDEFEEHVEALYEGFVVLERDPDQAGSRISELFRAAHSLKGAAQMMGLTRVADVADRMESTLARIRDGDLDPTPSLVQPLVAATEALDETIGRLRRGEDVGEEVGASLLDALADTAEGADAPSSGSAAALTTGRRSAEPRSSLRIQVKRLDALLENATDVEVSQQRVQQTVRDFDGLRDLRTRHGRAWRALNRQLDGIRSTLPPRTAAAVDHARTTWQEIDETIRDTAPAMRTGVRELRQAADALGQATTSLRMAPLSDACDGLERTARQGARSDPDRPKSVELSVVGGEVELERQIVTGLRDALNHLVRNAVDHGLEPVAEREAAGKEATGSIVVRGELDGGRATITVSDDGRGLDEAALLEAAEQRGVASREGRVTELAFAPGLSTSSAVTDISGRGVGLDAVRARVEQLGGWIELDSQPGRGTTVTMSLPTTLSRFRAVLVEAGDETVAIPASGAARIERVPVDEIGSVAGEPALGSDHGPVRLISLARTLGFEEVDPRDATHVTAVVVGQDDQEAALTVDRLVGEAEVTARDLGERVAGAPGVLGVTQTPTGSVVLVLNPAACARIGLERDIVATLATPDARLRAPGVLLVEDSLTTRSLEQAILEAAGYEVVPATDGLDAWRRLEHEPVDLVITDVEMPRMDGFALCEAIRRSPSHAELPVVLVTSRAEDEDRRRGLEAGANAYLTKAEFDHGELLEIIARLV